MANKFKQYDSVELMREMMSDGAVSPVTLMRAGQKGVIVEVSHRTAMATILSFLTNSGVNDHDRGGHQTE